MSFDYTIKSDETFSGRTSLRQVRAILHAQPGVRPGDTSFVVVDAFGEACMVIYAELTDSEGNCLDPDPSDPEAVNCVRVTVPYDQLEGAGRRALELSLGIAERLSPL